MRVLVACEFSGRVRDAFTAMGHDATSCDLLESVAPGGKHYQGDVRDLLREQWDMMIAFPPCTHLAISGARYFKQKQAEQEEALNFVRLLMLADIPKIAIENPVSVISTRIRPPDQIIQPWQFGHGETKKTCLWLKQLPPLLSTYVVQGRTQKTYYAPDSKGRAMRRSMTYTGIAEAMAQQWGYVENLTRG